MFRQVKFNIDGQQYNVLLIADDDIYVDEKNKVVYLNQTSWVLGETPLAFPINSDIKVNVSHLPRTTFENIVNGDKKMLAHFLTSENKAERELAFSILCHKWAKLNDE